MKKFLKKKPVMITLLVCAVALLGLYIFLMARPVAYGLTYKNKTTKDGVTTTSTYKFWSDKQATIKTVEKKDGEVVEDKASYWIYRDGKYITGVGLKELKVMTDINDLTGATRKYTKDEIKEYNKDHAMSKDEYKDAIKLYDNLSADEWELGYKAGAVIKVNAFKMTLGDQTYVCAGQIVITVVLGIVELALIAGATYSVVLNIKKK